MVLYVPRTYHQCSHHSDARYREKERDLYQVYTDLYRDVIEKQVKKVHDIIPLIKTESSRLNLSFSFGIERQSDANIDGKSEEHTRPCVAARRSVQRRFRAQLRQKTEKETVLKGSGHSPSYATIVDQIDGEVPAEGRLFL